MTQYKKDAGKITVLDRPSVADMAAAADRLLAQIDKMSQDARLADHPDLTMGLLFKDPGCFVSLENTFDACIEANRRHLLEIGSTAQPKDRFRMIDFGKLYAPGYVSYASVADFLRGKAWADFVANGTIYDKIAA